jgi:hypothetical protein
MVTLLPAHSDSGREPTPLTVSTLSRSRFPKKRNCIFPPTTDDWTGTPKKSVRGTPSIVITPESVLKLICSASAATGRSAATSAIKARGVSIAAGSNRAVAFSLRIVAA